jgi:NAD(P)-dependent dehydrogenase (short-subunit alcohol dehydrogenase family)
MGNEAIAVGALQGKTAIVTGGTSTFGLGAARALIERGATVVLADGDGLTEAMDGLNADGRVLTVRADLTDAAALEQVVRTTLDHCGRVDILVNAAGEAVTPAYRTWNAISDDEWHDCVNAQVTSVWVACRAVAPTMKQQKSGRIINVGSSAVMTGLSGYLPYVASKSALLGMTRAIARELGEHGIAVNMIYPPLQVGSSGDEQFEAEQAALEPSLGHGATDIGGALAFLCGDGVDFITGQTWIIDRGSVLQ